MRDNFLVRPADYAHVATSAASCKMCGVRPAMLAIVQSPFDSGFCRVCFALLIRDIQTESANGMQHYNCRCIVKPPEERPR